MNPSFWRDKRVLVTGHTGFKGSWLCLWLQLAGAQVHGYSLPPPTRHNLFQRARVGAGMDCREGDVRDVAALVASCEEAAPEIVFHLAAQALVRRSYEDPLETLSTNVLGTANVLEAVRRTGHARAVVVVTSDKCYENREWVWGYRERDPLGGFDPYSSSKACAELATAAWRNAVFGAAEHARHGTAVATARAGNVIGGGDFAPDRLVPDLVRAALSDRAPRLRHPDAVRPWQHVLDPLNGYLVLAERLLSEGPAWGGAWNFGPAEGDARPVRWVAERVRAALPGALPWEPAGAAAPHEAATLRLDVSKAIARLRWRPRWSLAAGIDRTVEWYRAHAAGAEMRKHTLGQIEAFARVPDG